ncbi:hypothetical protein EXN24_13625 [Rhizobium rhizogenes]|uniref:Uncharacterized protein n=1 Tax=Rhizobium rhizogenes TaxID=359 RepID=A0AA95AHY8_RHIRH|nr:hypothetical protein EXN24_13625 [Rhizobium rhizogenes]
MSSSPLKQEMCRCRTGISTGSSKRRIQAFVIAAICVIPFSGKAKNRWFSDEISVLKGSVVACFSHFPSLPQDQFYRHMLDSSPHL